MTEQRWIIGILASLVAIGVAIDHVVAIPPNDEYIADGLRFEHPEGFIAVDESLYRGGRVDSISLRYDLLQSVVAPRIRIEVRMTEKPEYSNLSATLSLRRATRYGSTRFEETQSIRNVSGRDWHRASFIYPFKPSEVGSPQIVRGIQYAATFGDTLVSITLHGSADEAKRLAEIVERSLELSDPNLL